VDWEMESSLTISVNSATSSIKTQPPCNNLNSFTNYVDKTLYEVFANHVTPQTYDFGRLQPNFGFVPTKRILQQMFIAAMKLSLPTLSSPMSLHMTTEFSVMEVL
jgi:hypothetical protein